MPQIIIIAGPNGAGKTSFANKHFDKPRADLAYLNADEIARDMAATGLPQSRRDARAGRAMLKRMDALAARRASFMFETTLASLAYARRIPAWRERGYVVGCGTWSPHINGCAVPVWSPQYQTFVVVTIGLLSAMFDEKRLHAEVAPQMIELGAAIGGLLEGAEGDIFANRIERKPLPVPVRNNNKIIKTEDTNELEAGARRASSGRMPRVTPCPRTRLPSRPTTFATSPSARVPRTTSCAP